MLKLPELGSASCQHHLCLASSSIRLAPRVSFFFSFFDTRVSKRDLVLSSPLSFICNHFLSLSLVFFFLATMDALVAKYSRPAFQQNESFAEQDEQDVCDSVPSLSLRFAMPPVAHVGGAPLSSFYSQRRRFFSDGPASFLSLDHVSFVVPDR